MTLDAARRENLYDLLDLLFEEQLGDADGRRLAELLADSDEAQWIYVSEMNRHADLAWSLGAWNRGEQGGENKVQGAEVERGEGRGEREKAEEVVSGQWPVPSMSSPASIPLSAFPLPPSVPSHSSYPSHSPLSPLHSPLFSINTPLGGFLVSYGASTVFVGILIFIFSLMNSPSQRGEKIVGQSATGYASAGGVPRAVPVPEEPAPEIVSIANITGMVDCKWVDARQAPAYYKIKLHDKFALVSGLMEITYKTGARVILQGPCTYEVESTSGGYLSLGKLTARVEKTGERGEGRGESEAKAEGGGRKAEEAVASGQWPVASEKEERGEGRGESENTGKASGTLAPSPQPLATNSSPQALAPSPSSVPSPLSPLPSPLFAVRTPTAIVTDLGTEFGVEVSEKGETQSCVFLGKVAMVAMDGDGNVLGERVVLGEGEVARVTPDRLEVVEVIRGQDVMPSDAFVCEMPKRGPLMLFNTGSGLSEGNEDPHWQIVARSDDPNFKPRPAAVSAARAGYVPNDPSRSQWISLAGDDAKLLPDNVVYTFRTTFDLGGFAPNTAFVQVRSLADDCVKTIRLNGKRLSLADDSGGSFTVIRCDTIRKGFVRGVNTLEFDVLNGDSWNASRQLSPMALRVELEGSCIPLPGGSAEKEGRESSEALRPKSGTGVGSPISSQPQTP